MVQTQGSLYPHVFTASLDSNPKVTVLFGVTLAIQRTVLVFNFFSLDALRNQKKGSFPSLDR